METYKFSDVIDVAKHSGCATCNTFIYTLPCEINANFGDFISSVGKLAYPLHKVQIIRLKGDNIILSSYVGRRYLEAKFLGKFEDVKMLLELGLAAYVSNEMEVEIEMGVKS